MGLLVRCPQTGGVREPQLQAVIPPRHGGHQPDIYLPMTPPFTPPAAVLGGGGDGPAPLPATASAY